MDAVHYWLYAPGEKAIKWDEYYQKGIMAIGWGEIGDLNRYKDKESMKIAMKKNYGDSYSYKHAAHATWQFSKEMKPGDIVFVKKGLHQIVGRGIVDSDYYYDEAEDHYSHVRKVEWTHKGVWDYPSTAALKTLTDITFHTESVNALNSIFDDEANPELPKPALIYPKYTSENFLQDVYMDRASYDELVNVLLKKKNVILQGPPGVGKTYLAKRLAYSIMGEKDPSRITMVQFHQSYSYEDFIMGFRPTESGFILKKGVFYDFCKAAEEDDSNTPYFFIIDEINRGNLSKIFGELFMLIEKDKRGIELQLLYANEKFSIPENVYIIGMMNTADRSLAMMDYALRRRFSFFEMKPSFQSEGFQKYRRRLNSDRFDRMINCVESLNVAIAEDDSLGEGFCIGHSFFCDLEDAEHLSHIVEYELIPLLKEYWFDEPVKLKNWVMNLRNSVK